jgi:pimeloyl-ACP methyl ester carboxylesterase
MGDVLDPPDLPEPDRAVFVDVNRTRLRVWEWGDEAAPPILLVHGAHDHGRMWDGFAPRLARLGAGYRVMAIDIRGHGDSGRLPHGHVWSMCTMDLGVLARRLGPTVGIVGHSFGAGLSGMAAGVWPEQFRWVVNLDGLGPPDDAPNGPLAQMELGPAAAYSIEWADKVLNGPPRVYPTLDDMVERRARTNIRLPRPWVEHLVAHGSIEVEGGFVWKADPAFRTGFPGDFDIEFLEAEMRGVTSPILVLTGAEDDTWSDHSQEVIDRRMSYFADGRHRVIADAGHYVHVEQPDAVLDAIAEFLAEVGP